MNLNELMERLKGYEWHDLEIKEAANAIPNSAYETVSAFANTSGGWLVFGVKEKGKQYEITGVADVDKLQNDFLNVLNGEQKLNRRIAAREFLIRADEKDVLVFHIAEAIRQEKPVYLNNDIWKSYIRRGGCDHKCSNFEIERFLRDASSDRYDSQTVDLDLASCFSPESVRWYRSLFYSKNPEKDQSLTDQEFLYEWGFLSQNEGKFLPTRASILVFGSQSAILQTLPRPILDCQWINTIWSAELPEERWSDRLTLENNLIETWKALLNRYQQGAIKPFSVEPDTLQRSDEPPDYIAFREAAINLLIHQDFGDHTRIPRIQFFQGATVFFNPGDAFVDADKLLEPGEREVRNSRIVNAFRRIGLSEQAGTGVRSIFQNWRQLRCVPPIIINDKSSKFFQLTLLREILLSEQQLLFQAKLGLSLTEPEADVFALICRQSQLRLIDVRKVTGLSPTESQALVDRLKVQALIAPVDDEMESYYVLVDHLKNLLTGEADTPTPSDPLDETLISDQDRSTIANLITDQDRPLAELTETHWKILQFCDVPRSLKELMDHLELAHRPYFKRNYLSSLLSGGLLSMTHPDRPTSRNQAYVLTQAGIRLKATRLQ